MNEISIIEALYITFSSMAIVILTLSAIALILSSFKYIFKEKDNVVLENRSKSINQVSTVDEEEEMLIACLAASAMAGDGKINPNLHIKRVTRIK